MKSNVRSFRKSIPLDHIDRAEGEITDRAKALKQTRHILDRFNQPIQVFALTLGKGLPTKLSEDQREKASRISMQVMAVQMWHAAHKTALQ
jgi:hypothetical protein